jgi:hypothetical protein
LCFGVSRPGERHHGLWNLRFKKCQWIGTPEGLIEVQSCSGIYLIYSLPGHLLAPAQAKCAS